MHLHSKLAALAGALIVTGAAHAAILTGTSGAPGNLATDYSGGGLVSFDLDLQQLSPTRLIFTIEDADLAAPFLGLNAIVRNLSGEGIGRFNLALEGISFAAAGSVTPTFGALGNAGIDGGTGTVLFSTPEWAEFHLGNPLGTSGLSDWQLSTAGLHAGDSFAIASTVPEPAPVSLMLAALVTLAWTRRRRDRR